MSGTIIDVITHDHAELDEYYNNILNATDNDAKVRWQNQFTWELARHSIAEEIVVYPALEKYVQDGKRMADNDREQHNEVGVGTFAIAVWTSRKLTSTLSPPQVKVLLKNFQNLSPSSADFEPTIRELMGKLSQHIKEEETEDLPKLQAALSDEHSKEMAESFQRTKMFVPTRSHPSAPDKPVSVVKATASSSFLTDSCYKSALRDCCRPSFCSD
jgi:hemerythrin-like domain-containing protein